MKRAIKVQSIKYGGPGWTIDLDDEHGTSFDVWAPGGNRGRDHWAAAWSSHGGWRGDFKSGPTLESVLDILPSHIAQQFRLTIEQG